MRFSRDSPARRTPRTMDIIMRLLVVTMSGLGLELALGMGLGLVGAESLGRLVARDRDAFDVYARHYAREYSPYMFAAIPLHAPVPVLRVLSRAPLPALPQPPRAADTRAAPSAPRAVYTRPYLPEPLYSHPHRQDADLHYADSHYAEPHYAEPHYGRQEAPAARLYARPAPARPYAAEQEYEPSSYEYAARPSYYRKPPRQASGPAPASGYDEYGSYAPQLRVRPSPLPQLTYAIAPYESEAYATQEVLYARPSPSGGFTYRRVPDATATSKKKASTLKEKEKDPPFILKIHKYRIVKDDLI